MTTSVYGNRDFKGNVVSNAAMNPVGGAPGLWPAPVYPTHSGHAQWSADNKKPYWWNPVDGKWVSYSESGSTFYGVRTGAVTQCAEIDCSATPPILGAQQPYDTANAQILSAAQLAQFPEISVEHPLVVDLSIYTGFTVVNSVNNIVEDYNRKGALIIRTYMLEPPTGTTTNPPFYGIWYHGWEQPMGTDTLNGKLGAGFTTIAKTVETPIAYVRGDLNQSYRMDSVDVHTMLVNADAGNSCELSALVGGIHEPAVKWRMNYDDVNGLVFYAESIHTSSLFHLAYTYTDPWVDCADAFPGFFGMPIGYYTTYWF